MAAHTGDSGRSQRRSQRPSLTDGWDGSFAGSVSAFNLSDDNGDEVAVLRRGETEKEEMEETKENRKKRRRRKGGGFEPREEQRVLIKIH
ncbi:hypothetical protein V1477_011356 [Vespula maculifrons]|uniref:Uncharacterized protein n=2 Tax=Vespula TaxID=7451 RepID=A0A834NHT4_VESGE|nr:hypothetical protein HZH68_004243 [Vespula germanica]